MIAMKHRLVLICSAILFLVLGARAQGPTMVFDGNKLSINVPSGRLEFKNSEIENEAIRNCFEWGGRENCMFMARSDAYVFRPTGLSTDEKVSIQGVYNGEPITITVEMRPVQKTQPTIPGEKSKEGPSMVLLIIATVVALAVLVLVFYLLRRKKVTKETDTVKYDPNVISIIKDESIKYEHGLSHVVAHPNEYITFDMDSVYDDTAVKKVFLSTGLIKKLYEFFSNSLESDGRTNETGCFIVGCWDCIKGKQNSYDISLEYMVEPGDDADFGEYSLHFGKKISINMASIIDNLAQKTKRDYLLTCWMHSHPGLGLFLSSHDLIVQKQLTYSDHKNRLLAIVIDTNTPELKTGFFTAKKDGTMNNNEDVKRWFSFEDIYREGRELSRSNAGKEEVQEKAEECFGTNPDCFNITLKGDTMDYLGFAAHAINQIDTTLYSCGKGVVGYLFGDEHDRYLEVGCCLPYDNEEKIGCLVYGDGLKASQLSQYASDIADSKVVVNCTSDDKIIVWVKNAKGSFENVGESALTQMKEWIRRKRV